MQASTSPWLVLVGGEANRYEVVLYVPSTGRKVRGSRSNVPVAILTPSLRYAGLESVNVLSVWDPILHNLSTLSRSRISKRFEYVEPLFTSPFGGVKPILSLCSYSVSI
jgi:hypothetical protein